MNNSKQTTWDEERDAESDLKISENAAAIFIDQETMDWVDCVADCYETSANAIAHHFLNHGCKNYEEILD